MGRLHQSRWKLLGGSSVVLLFCPVLWFVLSSCRHVCWRLDFFKEEPVKEDIQTDEEPLDKSYESLVIDDSNSQNSISETEELKSEQSQSDNSCESDSESLLEEEYTSTNPFKNKYSVLTYKFRNYTITIEKPCITDIIGEVKHHLEAKDLFLMLRNEYEINTL